MFGWVKSRIQKASTDAMRDDLARFIESLRGAGDYELGMLLVVANAIRLNFIATGKLPPAALNLEIPRTKQLEVKCDTCPIELNSAIRAFQKLGQPTDAAGTMVWLHSVRALNVPELRLLGRHMWGELSRGFPHAAEALGDTRRMGGKNLPDQLDDELTFVPVGLEPEGL